jgi:hypothetical protein
MDRETNRRVRTPHLQTVPYLYLGVCVSVSRVHACVRVWQRKSKIVPLCLSSATEIVSTIKASVSRLVDYFL